jgi:DNA-damage-inducible protein J
MHKVATINARIEPKLKADAENILHKVGLTSAEAVRLFYKQICLRKGLPFDVRVPNKTTLKAMRDADAGRTHKAKSVDELFEALD